MSTLGWIVPSHRPRKNYLLKLVQSFLNFSEDTDLIIVWSYYDDNYFDSHSNFETRIKHLYLQDYYSLEDIKLFETTRSIINVKKLFAIIHEYTNYLGLVCTDDEVEFVKKFNGEEVFITMKKLSLFPATDISSVVTKDRIIERVISECIKFIPDINDRILMKEITKDFSIYSWFSNLPFYDSRDIPDFLKKFEILNYHSLSKISFFHFEHILYQYYCILNGTKHYRVYDWSYEQLGIYNWFECFHLEKKHLYSLEYQNEFKPYWASSNSLLEVFDNAFCVFHTDRENIKVSKYLLCKHYLKLLLKTLIK